MPKLQASNARAELDIEFEGRRPKFKHKGQRFPRLRTLNPYLSYLPETRLLYHHDDHELTSISTRGVVGVVISVRAQEERCRYPRTLTGGTFRRHSQNRATWCVTWRLTFWYLALEPELLASPTKAEGTP